MLQLVFDVMEQGDLTPVIIKKAYYLTMQLETMHYFIEDLD